MNGIGRFTVPDAVRDVLRRSTIEDAGQGFLLTLPEQLDRKTYLATNKFLEAAGGTWQRKFKCHVFARDPREVLGLAVETGQAVDEKKARGAFYTPDALADRVAELAGIDGEPWVLEPSFGGGALVRAVWRRNPRAVVHGIELDERTRLETETALIKEASATRFSSVAMDFLAISPDKYPVSTSALSPTFDAVAMNPPFAKDQDAVHVVHALRFLRPGGRLVAIVAGNALARSRGKAARALRETFDACGDHVESCPEGSFRESGTNVRTSIVVLVKAGAS